MLSSMEEKQCNKMMLYTNPTKKPKIETRKNNLHNRRQLTITIRRTPCKELNSHWNRSHICVCYDIDTSNWLIIHMWIVDYLLQFSIKKTTIQLVHNLCHNFSIAVRSFEMKSYFLCFFGVATQLEKSTDKSTWRWCVLVSLKEIGNFNFFSIFG